MTNFIECKPEGKPMKALSPKGISDRGRAGGVTKGGILNEGLTEAALWGGAPRICGAELKLLADSIVISYAPPPFLLRRERLYSEAVFST